MCTQEDSTEKTSSRSSISTGLLKFNKRQLNVRKKSWAEFMRPIYMGADFRVIS